MIEFTPLTPPRLFRDDQGRPHREATFVASGLTANASNTVPHGESAPRRVLLGSIVSGTTTQQPALDGSQGDTDPTGKIPAGHTGSDATNLYIITPPGITALLVHMEW